MPRSLLSILLLVATIAPSAPGYAARWVPIAPPSVLPRSGPGIELGPGTPPLLFVSSPVGILRSADRGADWELGNGGLSGDLALAHLVADPSDPSGLYLSASNSRGDDAGVYRSDDAGRHWRNAGNQGLPVRARRNVTDLVADPATPSRLLLASLLDGLFESADGGATWRSRGAFPAGHYLDRIGLDPSAPATLYVAGSGLDAPDGGDPLELFRSLDGGAHLERLDLPGDLAAASPEGLLVTGGAPETVYVATLGAGVYRSADGGATWLPANEGLPVGDLGVEVLALAVAPSDPETLYAAVPAAPGSPAAVFRTRDGGDHWSAPAPGGPELPEVRDLVVDPGDPLRLYAAPGPFASEDGGETWRSIACDLPPSVAFVTPDAILPADPANPVILYAGGGTAGLQRTRDAGATWEPVGTGLPLEFRALAHDLAVDPADPDLLFLATTVHFPSPPETGEPVGGLFKSEDGGLTWVPATGGGLPATEVESLLLDRRAPDELILFAVTGDLYEYLSTDPPPGWVPIISDEPYKVTSVALDPSDPKTIFAGISVASHPTLGSFYGIARIEEVGSHSWDLAFPHTDLPSDAEVTAVAVDPVDSRIVAFGWEGVAKGGVERSADGGRTWTPVGADLPEIGVSDLLFDPRAPSVLWIGTEGRGVFRSADLGDSWSPLNAGLGPARVNDLDFGPGGLYAATDRGLFRLDDSPGAGEPPPPDGLPWIADATYPGFRFKVRIAQGSAPPISGTREAACLPETVCLSGAVPGRSELFLRIVGPKPNGWLWPTLVKFSTSEIEVWIEQLETGRLRYYDLAGASPGVDALPGLFDRFGFQL